MLIVSVNSLCAIRIIFLRLRYSLGSADETDVYLPFVSSGSERSRTVQRNPDFRVAVR